MKPKLLSVVVIIFQLILVNGLAAFAQQAGVSLRDGVVIDKARNTIYVLSPDKKLQALSLASGEVLWTSADSLKPLALTNGRLFAQAINARNEFVITQLDMSQKGKQLTRNSIALPTNIKTDFRPSTSSVFKTYARLINGETYILWEYHTMPLRGVPDEDTARKDVDPIAQSGIIRVDRTTGRLTTGQKSALPPAQLSKPIKISQNEGISNNADQQFLSMDDNHILTSRRVSGNEEFSNYLWEIFVRSSRTKVGELRDYRSFAPFYVTGSTIIYEVGPFTRLLNGDVQTVNLQLVAVDLANGRELWRRPIFDPNDRLSPPPGMK